MKRVTVFLLCLMALNLASPDEAPADNPEDIYWSPLGSGVDSTVYALTVYEGKLIAGGDFTAAGGVSANRIASWDGSIWTALGSGMNGSIRALTVYDNKLIAGGRFTTADGASANYIAAWDGATWLPLGSGMDGGSFPDVRALSVYDNELIAGGAFTTAGGKDVNHIASWNDSPLNVAILDDSGPGTLRNAIDSANVGSANDTITFSVSGTIELQSALPSLTDNGTKILGSTAPGGTHSVIIDGSSLTQPSDVGLVISGASVDGCKIEGLTIRNFPNAGIRVVGSPLTVHHTITNNLVYDNGGLAIDLHLNGVTANDPGDTDTGPNTLLNYPEVDSVRMNVDNSYSVYGRAASSSVIEYFVAHPAEDDLRPADPTGHGEAYSYVISDTAEASGAFESAIPSSVPQFTVLSCTATDPSGNTSEMNANFNLTPAPLIFVATSQPAGGKFIPPSVVNLWITDPNGDYLGRDAAGNLSQTLFPADYDQEAPIYDDSITIHDPLLGEYIIEIIAENGAGEGDRYSINVRIDGSAEVVLAREMDVPLGASGPDTIRYVVEEGCDYINGDANGSGGEPPIDIDDIVFLITYVFASGPAPEPLMSGDANCSQFIDIDDIVWLIGYVFAGAAPPCSE